MLRARRPQRPQQGSDPSLAGSAGQEVRIILYGPPQGEDGLDIGISFVPCRQSALMDRTVSSGEWGC